MGAGADAAADKFPIIPATVADYVGLITLELGWELKPEEPTHNLHRRLIPV